MKFGVWRLRLNGTEIVRQVQVGRALVPAAGECRAQSLLMFLSLGNPDLGLSARGSGWNFVHFLRALQKQRHPSAPFSEIKLTAASVLVLWETDILPGGLG